MNILNYISKHGWQILVLILLIIVFFTRNPFGCNKPIPDTVKSDTVRYYITQPIQYVPQYTPQQTSSQPIINIPPQYQPSNDIATLVQQYKELTARFLATNTYVDSIPLKDSSGKRVGVVNLKDEVQENQIKTRKPSYQLSFPVTTITNTITKHEQPRNKFYLLGEIGGNKTSLVNNAASGLLWQNKKDQLYYFKAGVSGFSSTLTPEFTIGTGIKIGK